MSQPWTLFVDESGSFEEPEKPWVIIGGPLCPGTPENLRAAWFSPTRQWCQDHGHRYPPHANQLPVEQRAPVLAWSSQRVNQAGGRWLALGIETRQHNEFNLYRWVRAFGELVQLAARLVAREGGTELAVVVAQRTVPWEGAAPEGLRKVELEDGPALRPLAEIEVRVQFDWLFAEDPGLLPGWPRREPVQVPCATAGQVHPGILCADFFCNLLLHLINFTPGVTLQALAQQLQASPSTVWLAPVQHTRTLRRIDRALRNAPADLVAAARAVTVLANEAAARAATQAPAKALWESSARLADGLWTGAQPAWAQAVQPAGSQHALTLARNLALQAEAQLSAKTGDYRGTWLALRDGWVGPGPLATALAQGCQDRELAARLWRLVLECANHLGDVAASSQASQAFEAVLRAGPSLALLAQRLVVNNLRNVALQNQLPCPAAQLTALRSELETAAEALIRTAQDASAMVALAALPVHSPRTPPLPGEAALWIAAGRQPPAQPADSEIGRCHGTAARSLAFLGFHEQAQARALEARQLFDDPFDLRFNAAVLARIELEAQRLNTPLPHSVLAQALRQSGVPQFKDPQRAVELIRADPAVRFTLDLLLRYLLWGQAPPDPQLVSRGWRKLLRGMELFDCLSREFRDHPTELIARHAGEWLRADGPAVAERWFDLSIRIARELPGGAPFAQFSELLQRGEPATGPYGCITNPSFEYR